jgi:hypothetical protein
MRSLERRGRMGQPSNRQCAEVISRGISDLAMWFAFNCAKSPDSEPALNAVIIVVDSEALETRCRYWLETNKE